MKRMWQRHTGISEMWVKTGSFEDNRLVHVHLSSNDELNTSWGANWTKHTIKMAIKTTLLVICMGNSQVFFAVPGPVPVNNPYPWCGYG